MENMSNENKGVVKHEKKKKDKMVLWIIIIALLGVNVVLLYNLMNKSEQLATTTEELDATAAEKAKLDTLYEEGLRMIALLEKDTTQLNDELREKLAVIKLQNEEIDKIRKQKNWEISKLKKKVKEYEGKMDQLLAELDEMKKDNEYLRQSNTELLSIRKQQGEKIDQLEETTSKLAGKVNIASKLRADNFTVVGVKERSGGKERETSRANATDKIKITFDLGKNYVVEPGPKEFYIKINKPDGSTLAVESNGSGTFVYNGEESLYTVSTTIEYDVNEDQSGTVYWSMNNEFAEGDYHCELYEGGFLIAETELSLR